MTSRYHIEAGISGETVCLDDEESHHFLRVMRGRVGDSIEVFGGGLRYVGKVVDARKGHPVEVMLLEKGISPPCLPIFLCCVIPWIRGGKSETVVQKLAELGVQRIVLFQSVRETAHGGEAKLGRLRRVAAEACKQCGRDDVPAVDEAETLLNAIGKFDGDKSNRLILYENERSLKLTDAIASGRVLDAPARVLLASGPEGGFDPTEIASVADLVTSVGLGPLILRAETAPIVAVSAILALAGRF